MLRVQMKGLLHKFLLVNSLVAALSSSLMAMAQAPTRYDGWGRFGGYDRRLMKLEGMRQKNAAILECQRERARIAQADPAYLQNQRYKDLTAELELLTKKDNPVGAVIARGLAGADWEALEDITISSPAEGFWQGVTIRTSRALGDIVAKKVESTVDRILGSAWDAALDKITEYARDASSLLLHNSKDPFTPEELKIWSEIIGSCLDGFAKLIRGRVEFESRSKDMNSRAFDSEDQSAVNQDQVICDRLLCHYAAQCDYYAQMIEKRKGYYKEDAEIVFIADQLKDWLTEFKTIVLSIKSLKEVAAKFGPNNNMITETGNNIKKLFDKLVQLVTPTTSLLSERNVKRTAPSYADTSTRRDYSGRYGAGTDSDYPQPYNGYDY